MTGYSISKGLRPMGLLKGQVWVLTSGEILTWNYSSGDRFSFDELSFLAQIRALAQLSLCCRKMGLLSVRPLNGSMFLCYWS